MGADSVRTSAFFPKLASKPRDGTLITARMCLPNQLVASISDTSSMSLRTPGERTDTLRKAFDLAREFLIVSVRVDQALDGALSYADGYLTSHGSFQKLYTQAEFREYLNTALGRRPYVAGL